MVLESNAYGKNSLYHGMTTPTKVEELLFLHYVFLLSKAVKRKVLKNAQFYASGTLIGYRVYLVTKMWSQLLNLCCTDEFQEALAPYMWYDKRIVELVVFQAPQRGHQSVCNGRIRSAMWARLSKVKRYETSH